jgi:DNA relaxase NicK
VSGAVVGRANNQQICLSKGQQITQQEMHWPRYEETQKGKHSFSLLANKSRDLPKHVVAQAILASFYYSMRCQLSELDRF